MYGAVKEIGSVEYNSESPVLFDSLTTYDSCMSDEMGPYTGETEDKAISLELFGVTDIEVFTNSDYFEDMSIVGQ